MERGFSTRGEIQADELTWREQEVLLLLADRCTNREIADQLHLAESTVKDYVSSILNKLYVKNRRQAVERAKELGLLEPRTATEVGSAINLPAEATQFVGRRAELAEIEDLIGHTRLLTLIGPGGIGKSRLAVKAAREAAPHYPDGTYFVPLAPISSPDHLVQTIAESLKFPLMSQEDPRQQLLRFLGKKKLLLVMDNFEHLLEGAEVVSQVLPAAPGVTVLATSREKLNLHSETVFIVPGMDYSLPERPPIDELNDASQLFIQSARKVRPGFEPSQQELPQIEKICHIVQGTPLAIELAAAWLQILTLDEITAELEGGLDILSTEARDAPLRHRSLRAVFNHSWNLLDQGEKKTLRYLSIFRGGFTRQAAQQVAGASLVQLMELVNKSFLSYNPDTRRLEFHELLRQYAQEKLENREQEIAQISRAHASYFAEFMLERWQHLKDRRQLTALGEIEADIENMRTAWRYWLEHRDSAQLWKFSKTIWLSYFIKCWHLAGTQLFAGVARQLEGCTSEIDQAMRGLAMASQGFFLTWLDISEEGYQLTKTGVEILQQLNCPEELVLAQVGFVVNGYFLGRFDVLIPHSNQMLSLARESNDPWLLVFSLYVASLAALPEENYSQAKKMAEEQLRICEGTGDLISSAYPLIILGHAAFGLGDYEMARDYYQRCCQVSQKVGFLYSLQIATKYLGKVNLTLGYLSEAEQVLTQCLVMTKDIGFMRDVINLYYEFARLRLAQEQPYTAVELLAYVIRHPYSDNRRMMEGRIRDSAQQLLDRLEAELPVEDFQLAIERSQQLELDEIYADLVKE